MRQTHFSNCGRYVLLLLFSIFFMTESFAQSKLSVTGQVIDELGYEVIGASVSIKGTTIGTVTDLSGNFTLDNVPTNGILKVSYIGFLAQDVKVNNKSSFKITLKEDVQMLDDVVVVGYGVQRKSDLTGAVSSIKPGDAIKSIPSGNISDAMQGRMPGLTVVSGSGDPSKNNTMRIRGMGSISGDAGPLLVIDGFIGGQLQALNPSDIESIEVLKDASATAVYGSRGANGVILVTTKSPKEKMSVSFNSFLSVKTIAKKPSMLNPYDFATIANAYGKEYYESKGESPVTYFSDKQLQEYKDGTNPGFNYFDAITKDPAFTQNYEVSLSGGTDKLSVLASTRYNKSEGVIKNNHKELYNYRLKVDAKVKTWLDAGVNIFGRYTSHRGPRLAKYNGALIGSMFYPVTHGPYDENGEYINKYPLSGAPVINPIALVEEADNKFTYQHNQIQGYLNFKILEGLTFRTQLGLSLTNEHNTESFNSKSYEAFANSLTKAYGHSDKGTVFLNTNTLNYIKEFNRNHRINLTAVHEQYSSKIYWHRGTARGLHFEDLGANALGWADSNKSEVESERIISTLQSWMLRANYVLLNRYMFTASMRGDGTSRLSKKWDYFPSMSVAWDVLQENFMKNLENVSQMKLRFGYGVVGNQAIAPYQMYSQMGPVPTATGGTTYVSMRPAGDNLGWERNEQFNAGLDMGFFNGRLAVNVDLYKRVSKKLLLQLQQPIHVGYDKRMFNAGEIENKGIEVTFSTDPIIGRDFNWHSDLTFNFNKGKFTRIPTREGYQKVAGNYENEIVRMIEGEKISTFWGYNYLGVWQKEDVEAPFIAADGKPTGQTNGEVYGVVAGNPRYEDKNLNGKYDKDDQGIIGSGQPTFNWGWSNTFNYKDFDLSLMIVGFHGFDIYNATRQIGYNLLPSHGRDVVVPMKELKNRWTPENTNTDIPSFADEKNSTKGFLSNRFIEKGDFVRVKSITLGYTLPKVVCQKLQIQNLRLYASVMNPFTITSYKGLDPEATLGSPLTQGIDWGSYPNSRDFVFGLNFSF